MKKKNIGSTFDRFLRDEGLREQVSAAAIKRVVARQVEATMQGPTKAERAPRGRSRRVASVKKKQPRFS